MTASGVAEGTARWVIYCACFSGTQIFALSLSTVLEGASGEIRGWELDRGSDSPKAWYSRHCHDGVRLGDIEVKLRMQMETSS